MLSLISGAETLANTSSPQFLAALWVSDRDLMQLPLDSPQFLQRYFLATFYFALDGDNWVECGQTDSTCSGNTVYNSWLIHNTSECSWLGMKCDGNDVVEIFFRRSLGNGLRGTLPLELSFLTKISSLFLANNFISGTIPSFLGKLTNLNSLYLLGNLFNGPLSGNLFETLQLLKVLRLDNNALTGPIPTSLTALPLMDLKLENNELNGTIPGSIGSIPDLSTLQYCEPSKFRNSFAHPLPLVANLELQRNLFTGPIPDGLYRNQSIESLKLYDNFLTGTISSLIGEMVTLQGFFVGANKLHGTLPTEIFTLPALITLDVANNTLTGTLSANFAMLANNTTRSIVLDNNEFSGSIPTVFDKMSNLSKFLEFPNNCKSMLHSINNPCCSLFQMY